MRNKKAIRVLEVILILLIILFFYVLYTILDSGEKLETSFVTNVIDGDTIIIAGGDSVRLLGIDSAERGEDFYQEAKERLEGLVEQKQVILEKDSENKDKYGRLLRWVFLDDINVNLLLVEEGLARCYFYDEKKYKEECAILEQNAIKEKKGLWS